MVKPERRKPLELSFSTVFAWGSADDNHTSGTPVVLAADGLHGSLNVNADDEKLALRCSDIIRIDLSGILSSKFCEGQWAAPVSLSHIGYQHEILKISILRPSNIELRRSTANETYSFAFDYVLPHSSTNGSSAEFDGNLDHWSALPSSLLPQWQRLLASGKRIDYSADMKYYVQARIIRGGTIIAKTARPVIIFDTSEIAPPICTADFPSEYMFEQRRLLKKNLFAKQGSIQVTTDQPTAFQFDTSDKDALAQLRLSLTLDNFGFSMKKSSLDLLEMEVIWNLRTITFFSLTELLCAPTVAQAQRSCRLFHSTSLGRAHCSKTRLCHWMWQQSRNKEEVEGLWKTRESLWLVMPKFPLHAPTFFTSHLARRYSIELKIRFRGLGKAVLKFRVPCQILYRPTSIDRQDRVTDHSSYGIGMSLDATDIWGAEDFPEVPSYFP